MDTRSRNNALAVAAALVSLVLVQSAIADIPGATLTEVTNLSAPVYPRSLAAGPDGTIWFSEERLTPHAVGFFTAGGNVTQFPVPCDQCNGNGDRLANIESITVGPDGNAWFPYTYVNGDGSPLNGGMNSFIGRFTPAGQFTSFAVPTVDAFRRRAFNSAITAGPDGNLWFTENSPAKVGKITTAGIITEYALASTFAAPSIITKGADGNLWFTEPALGKIGRITPAGAITEFTAPPGPVSRAEPFGITSGPDGNLWYTDVSGAVGRVTPTGVLTRLELEANANPTNITTGADSKLYFPYTVPVGTSYQGKIAEFDPTSVSASASGSVIQRTAGVNTALLPQLYFAGELAQANGTAGAPMYFSVATPDSTFTIFHDGLWSLRVDPCNPPVTIKPHIGTDVTTVNYIDEFDITGGPNIKVTVSGLPPDWIVDPDVNYGGGYGYVIIYSDIFEVIGTYTFTITVVDGEGCSATLTITVHIVSKRHEAVKH